MSRSPVSRLQIRLASSQRLAALLVGSHVLAAAGLLASRLPGTFTVASLLILASSLAFSLRRYAWLSTRRSVVRVDLTDTLEFEAEDRSGDRVVGTVLGTSFVAPWLIVIHWKGERSRFPCAVVIMPDATDRESYRAARVWLRWRQADPQER